MAKIIIGAKCVCGHIQKTEFSKIDRPIYKADIGYCEDCGESRVRFNIGEPLDDDSVWEIYSVELKG